MKVNPSLFLGRHQVILVIVEGFTMKRPLETTSSTIDRKPMAKKEYTTINRGNENFLVIIGAVNGSPSKDKE